MSFSQSQDSYIIGLFSELFSQNNLNNFSITDLNQLWHFKEIPKKILFRYEFLLSDLEKSKIIYHKSIEKSFFGSQIYWPMQKLWRFCYNNHVRWFGYSRLCTDFLLIFHLEKILKFCFYNSFSGFFTLWSNYANL